MVLMGSRGDVNRPGFSVPAYSVLFFGGAIFVKIVFAVHISNDYICLANLVAVNHSANLRFVI